MVTFGLLPRVGPLRALVLGLSSRLFLRAKPVSQRTEEVAKLRSLLAAPLHNSYTIVSGPLGVGKTCLVRTATQKTFGVVTVHVHEAASEEMIMKSVFREIVHCEYKGFGLRGSTRRVLWWHRFFFGTPATVVLKTIECRRVNAFAALGGAARALVEDFGLNVVVDASQHSLPDDSDATDETVLEVGPMSREVLESVPDFAELLSALKNADLADVVWEAMGGLPAAYAQLHGLWKDASRKTGSDLETVVERYLMKLIDEAIHWRANNTIANHRLEELYALFTKQNQVPARLLDEWGLARPWPDRVLRCTRAPNGASVLVPVNAAAAVVLRFALLKPLRLPALKKLLCNTQPPLASSVAETV